MTNQQVNASSIAARLRLQIEKSELKPGEKLATVRDLAAEYDVAYNTVSRAIAALKAEGLLTGVRGGPTRVRVQPIPVVRDNRTYAKEKDLVLAPLEVRKRHGAAEDALNIAVSDLAHDTYDYEVVGCPGDVARFLQLEEGDEVLRRTYTRRHVEHAGAGTSTSFIPYAVVAHNPDLLDSNQEPWPGGTFHQLWTVGREVGRCEDLISATMPTQEEQETLDIPPNVPLFHLIKVVYDIQERPVECAQIPLPADRTTFRYVTPLDRW